MLLLRTFDKPTDVYIMGCDFDGITEDFSITDDESSCDIEDNNKRTSITTWGFVFIKSAEELKEIIDKMDDGSKDWDYDDLIIYLPNYTGDISLAGYDDMRKDVVDPEKYDVTEYFQYQPYLRENPDFEWVEPVVKLSNDSHMVPMKPDELIARINGE